ncbi:MAG: hypothetical protein QG604_62 [Candidatus Dependentiae bacterium]|nr:hypothetical protein [Candidatus Dependentiae bacterium]
MSVVLAIAGKKYTITSSSVDAVLMEKAALLFDAAAVEVQRKEPMLSEGQLCAMVAMRCIVPLLQEKAETEAALDAFIKELREVLPDR